MTTLPTEITLLGWSTVLLFAHLMLQGQPRRASGGWAGMLAPATARRPRSAPSPAAPNAR